jgi:hypothetical protein
VGHLPYQEALSHCCLCCVMYEYVRIYKKTINILAVFNLINHQAMLTLKCIKLYISRNCTIYEMIILSTLKYAFNQVWSGFIRTSRYSYNR